MDKVIQILQVSPSPLPHENKTKHLNFQFNDERFCDEQGRKILLSFSGIEYKGLVPV